MGTAVVMLTLLHIFLASFFGVYTAPDDSNLKRQMIWHYQLKAARFRAAIKTKKKKKI